MNNILSIVSNETIYITIGVIVLIAFMRKIYKAGIEPAFLYVKMIVNLILPLFFWMGRFSKYVGFNRVSDMMSDYIVKKLEAADFNARTIANRYWPEEMFPELYQEVRPGLKRAFFDDGKLLGGYDINTLINNIYSERLIRNALRTALETALIISVGFLLFLFAIEIASINTDFSGSEGAVEIFSGYEIKSSQNYLSIISAALVALFSSVVDIALFVAASVAVFMISAALIYQSVITQSVDNNAHKWREQTKDSLTRYRLRRSDVMLSRDAFRRALATDKYIQAEKGDDLIYVGLATGTFANRGAIGSPLKSEAVALDMESLFQHLLVFGGTGEGKTTAIIKPVFKQVVAIKSKKFGSMAMDAKGVFYRDLKKAADAAGRGDDVVLIGPDAEMMGIDILSNLRPSDLSAACKSVMTSAGGSGDNAFWSDMAATLIGHAAGLVFGVANLKKSNGETANDYYTISNIYQLIISDREMSTAISLFDSVNLRADYFSDDYDQIDQLRVSIDYLTGAWAEMAAATKTGIIANVSKILDPIYANPALGRKFSAANTDAQSITDIFEGKLFLFSISSIEHNIAAKLLQILIKSSFYRAARIREIKIGSNECNKKPVLVVIDEAQELLSADTSGLSDGSYWNVARSGGVAGIIGTQTIAALYQAMGKDQANNLVQQFRSKVFLRTEDTESHRYCIELAGQERRAMTYQTDTSESLEQLVNIGNVNFSDYQNETSGAADFAANIASSGIVGILSGEHQTMSKDAIDTMFNVDNRFTPSLKMAGFGTPENINDRINYMRDATWRAEDKYREWLREGNDAAPLLNVSDIINAGRYYAYAHIQRAGIPVQDVIEIKHDFN